MHRDTPEYPDQEDWEHESRAHYQRLMDDAQYEESERIPARIVVKIKSKKNDNQIHKGAPGRGSKKRSKS
jgi:hypothetical protein